MSARLIFVSLLLLLLTACSLWSKQVVEPENLILLPPEQGAVSSILKQVVTLTANNESSQFLVISKFEQQQIKVVVLLATGQTLLTLDYDGKALKKTVSTDIDLPAEEMLAMMQFALWPEQSLKDNYTIDKGWHLDINQQQRVLSNYSGKLLSVNYQEDTMIEHHRHHYQLLIHTLERKAL